MTFKILNCDVEADLFDPNVMAAFEDTVAATVARTAEQIEGEKASEGIRRQCQAVIDCIDTIFGQGSAATVFEGHTDLLKCLDAFEDVCFIHEQMTAEIEKRSKKALARANKYSAARAARK